MITNRAAYAKQNKKLLTNDWEDITSNFSIDTLQSYYRLDWHGYTPTNARFKVTIETKMQTPTFTMLGGLIEIEFIVFSATTTSIFLTNHVRNTTDSSFNGLLNYSIFSGSQLQLQLTSSIQFELGIPKIVKVERIVL